MNYLCHSLVLSCAGCNHPATHAHAHTHTHTHTYNLAHSPQERGGWGTITCPKHPRRRRAARKNFLSLQCSRSGKVTLGSWCSLPGAPHVSGLHTSVCMHPSAPTLKGSAVLFVMVRVG